MPAEHKSFFLAPEAAEYLIAHGTPPDPILERLTEETRQLGDISRMQISHEQGAFMELLTHVLAPRFAVEVGTFTGYSALCVARGLPPGGRLLCCDTSEDWTSVAQRYWAEAGVVDRIELRLGPAIETLRGLPQEPIIDLAFIDADKTGYIDYYEEIVLRLSDRAVVIVDNVLQDGAVLTEERADENRSLTAIREFNRHVAADSRTHAVMLPVADGLTFLRKR